MWGVCPGASSWEREVAVYQMVRTKEGEPYFVAPNGARLYVPVLDSSGKMQMWGVVSYGQGTLKGRFLLRVYLLVRASRMLHSYRQYRVPVHEETLDNYVSEEAQQQRVDLMLYTIATKAGVDFAVRQLAKTRKPK